ncbi:uncharacterized protein LOC135496073 [Lineus longissimus]|uniref:uncharacterized protein LOC135496073 n=1 Tax=Lineus longissimus TaxID=88925 RepID=UPI00315D1D6E
MVAPTVLKKYHTLKGISLVTLFGKLQECVEPKEYARMAKDEPLDDLEADELADRFHHLTGKDMTDVLAAAGRDSSSQRLVLHCAILLANEMGQPEGQRLNEPNASGSADCATVQPMFWAVAQARSYPKL